MYTGILHTHTLAVTLFFLLYLVKTFLLLFNQKEQLISFSKKTRVAEMIISTLFLITGIYLFIYSGNKGTWLYVKLIAVFASIPIAIIGFKRMNKALAVLSLLMITYAYGISETRSITFKKDHDADEFSGVDHVISGKTIFEKKCSGCHGEDGTMQLSGAKDLTTSTLERDQKIERIKNGKNSMKGFKDELSQEQINAVADYVESLKK